MRFWIGWWGGIDGDDRPIKSDKEIPAWANTGERMEDPEFAMVAVVDATDKEQAWLKILKYWPEAQERFCEAKPDDYMPRKDRFGVIHEKMAKKNA